MKYPLLITLILFFTVVSFGQKTNNNPISRVFTVNSNNDTNDANPSDGICADTMGNCTLRAAVQEANLTGITDTINFSLPDPAIINLTLGQLSIIYDLSIVGPGARKLTIQRSTAVGIPIFRIFALIGDDFKDFLTVANFSGLTIANGNAGNDLIGGAVFVGQKNYLGLIAVSIKNNTATSGGGIANFGDISLIRSTISNNFVPALSGSEGGGIYTQTGSKTRIVNSTISNNTAYDGGGITNYGTITSNNVTISHNSATNKGGGILINGGTVESRNTIIANNTAAVSAPNISGNLTSQGNNLISDGTGGTGFMNAVNNDMVGTSTTMIDPMLGALQNNGGQTDTRALAANSPAINKGNNCVLFGGCSIQLKSDQRTFYKRDVEEIVDIGAFEFGSNAVIVNRSITSLLLHPDNQRPISGAVISLTTPTGEVKYAYTNPFGYFRFNDLIIDEIYIFQVRHKRVPGWQFVLYLD